MAHMMGNMTHMKGNMALIKDNIALKANIAPCNRTCYDILFLLKDYIKLFIYYWSWPFLR